MKGTTYQRTYKDKDGTERKGAWCYMYDAPRRDGEGRRQVMKGGFNTQKEAQTALRAVLTKLDEGTYIEPSKDTVASFMRSWLDSIRGSGIRPSTFAAYETLAEKHIIPALGATSLQKLTPAMLNAFYGELLDHGRRDGKGGLSPRTVFYVHATVRKALDEGVRWQSVGRNVDARQSAKTAHPPRAAHLVGRRIEQVPWACRR